MKTAEAKTASKAAQQKANNPFSGKDGDCFFEKPIQAKLTVGKPNDPYEKEADSMADKVVQRMSAGKIENNEEETKISRKPIFESDSETVQRSCRECEEGDKVILKPIPGLQRSEEDQTPKNDGSRTSILAAAQGELGKVNARLDDGTGERQGADRLAEYFKIAAPGVWDESIIRTAGAKMPSWCGIFSVWAHKKAGKDLGNWQMGKGVSAFGTLTNTDSPQPGDIGYIHKPNQHHAVVKEVQGENILTIEGNSGTNSEVKENLKPKSAYTGFMTAFGAGGVGNANVQKKEEREENESPAPSVENRLGTSKGKGELLPEPTRQQMEQSFGASFKDVRIHKGGEANSLSKDLRAQAFTHGSDIYFNSGKYSPDSHQGRHLLAHELTHVVQQNGARTSSVQRKEDTDLCDANGKKRPKNPPNASSLLTAKYSHLAKVIKSSQLDNIQKCLDAQFKVSELLEKQKPFKDKIYFQNGGGYGGASSDVAQYNKYKTLINAQQDIIAKNFIFYVDSKLLAADDIRRPAVEDNEVMLAFHEQMYKRFTDVPVRVTVNPCQYDESKMSNFLLIYEWEAHPKMFWRLTHYNGLVTFRNLMQWQKWNIDYQKVHIGEMIKILERMMELRREIGDIMVDTTGKKIGEIHGAIYNTSIKVGPEIGSINGYLNDGRGYQSMYKDLMQAQHQGTARVVLLSPGGWLHIFACDHNFDTLEMTDPGNDGNLMVLDKKRSSGINIFEDNFYTKDGRQLKPHTDWFYGPGWSTPRELSELEEFAIGAILGDGFESNSGMATFGQIVIGLIPIVGQIADARDVCIGIHKIYESGGKDGKVQTAFALIGFVPLFGDWIKRAAKIGKNAPEVAKVAARTDAFVKGSEKMGDGLKHGSAKKIEAAADSGGKKAVAETLQAQEKVGKKFVGEVMAESTKVTDDAAQALSKTDSLAGDAAAAHGRKLTDLANPKVLAESSFKIGDAVHSVKVVEIGNMKQIWLCSTCGSLVGKIDEAMATAKGPALEKLQKLRNSAADLESKVTKGDVKPTDVDKKVGRITFELNDLARKNPDMGGLTKLLREDLERQYKLAYGIDDISKLSDGAKQALAKNYRPTPPGYHWRFDVPEPQVVRNASNTSGSKLVYDAGGHRFIVDEGTDAVRKIFGEVKHADAFAELGGKNLDEPFGKFVKTIGDEFGIPPQQFVDDMLKHYPLPKGVKDVAQETVRRTIKEKYVAMLYAHITDAARLQQLPVYKQVLESTKDAQKALRAASHEELLRVGKKLGPSDKGSLGEKWFKEWFANRGDDVAKQVTLGPQHGIKFAPSRRIDILEGHLCREVKNVTGHVGKEGAEQLEDLMAARLKEIIVDGSKTGFDSVRWVFLDPLGGAANASFIVEQLGKHGGGELSFQVLNKHGIPKLIRAEDLAKLGPDELKKMILAWTEVKPKMFDADTSSPDERDADSMADRVVKQQAGNMIQKDDDDNADAGEEEESKGSLADALIEYRDELLAAAEDADNDERARMRREALLIDLDIANAEATTTDYEDDELTEVISGMTELAVENSESERMAMEIIINQKSLGVTYETFIDSPYLLENANAFPKAFWEILSPLIAVRPERVADAESSAREALRMHQEASKHMTGHMYEHGLPVTKENSMNLAQYELIKSNKFNDRLVAMQFYKQRPRGSSELEFLYMPEETKLHKGAFSMYQMSWINYIVKKYEDTVYRQWMGSYQNIYRSVMAGDIPTVRIDKLKAFREKKPDGLYDIDELLRLGGTAAIQDMAATMLLMMEGFDPEVYLLQTKSNAANAASIEASSFVGGEIKNLHSYQYTASGKIAALDGNDRLLKAIDWSLEQGFTQQSIKAFIDNFGQMLEDLIKEFVEESLIKGFLSFIASLHPVGRIIAIAYNAYKTLKEASEAIDTAKAILDVAGIIDNARNAKTVVETQRSAAQLAYAVETLLPIIFEAVTSVVAARLKKGTKQPDPSTTGTTPPTPPTHTKAPDTGTGKTTTTTGSTTTKAPDIDPGKTITDKSKAPDKPTTPDKPDKNTTSTKTKVHGDPPKQLHESKLKVGGDTHTMRVVEMGGRKQIWVCTTCGNIVGKLDEAIAEAKSAGKHDVAKELERRRNSAASLEDKLNTGKVKPEEIGNKVGRITFEVNKIARDNPNLSSLNTILKEDLKNQYLASSGKGDIKELSPGAQQALAMGYRPTPPGYHWRKGDDNKLEVVRNPDGDVKKKLKYDDKEHRFVEDPEIRQPSKKFGKNRTPDQVFDDLIGDSADGGFKKFVDTSAKELGVSRADFIKDLQKQNPNGFDGKSHDAVRHKLKEDYVKRLYEKTTDQTSLKQSQVYKNELIANKGNEAAALKAASHAKMLELSDQLGPSDKGSLGEKWMKQNYASRDGAEVSKQVELGPEHGIVHKDKRRVDIVEDHLAREVKNVKEPLGKEGSQQLEDLLNATSNKAKPSGFDSVRLVFLDPVGGANNAKWMTQQLETHKGKNLSFQVLNKQGKALIVTPDMIDKFGKDGLEKHILNHVGVSKKSNSGFESSRSELVAERMANSVIARKTTPFFGAKQHDTPFFNKYN